MYQFIKRLNYIPTQNSCPITGWVAILNYCPIRRLLSIRHLAFLTNQRWRHPPSPPPRHRTLTSTLLIAFISGVKLFDMNLCHYFLVCPPGKYLDTRSTPICATCTNKMFSTGLGDSCDQQCADQTNEVTKEDGTGCGKRHLFIFIRSTRTI